MIKETVKLEIENRLARVEAEHNVRILFAVESGSRAWGFASPNSDYDVRFVYAHNPEWYLSVFPQRDVIEYPIVDDIDVRASLESPSDSGFKNGIRGPTGRARRKFANLAG